MKWRITDSHQPKKVVLMASKESHCLADILHRWHSKELPCEISCVIANHDHLRSMVEWPANRVRALVAPAAKEVPMNAVW